jgi:hypothetical protein
LDSKASCSGAYGTRLVSRHEPKAAVMVDCGYRAAS